MTTLGGEAHLSIGEVLASLQGDFPDVTISKIRFLESQGLLDPERTPSGYRKFYPADVARLRWILEQQRENFLPLKVIKERLETGVPGDEADRPEPNPAHETAEPSPNDTKEPLSSGVGNTASAPPNEPDSAPAHAGTGGVRRGGNRGGRASRAGRTSSRSGPRRSTRVVRPRPEDPPLPLDDEGGRLDDLDSDVSGASLTRADLAAASGLGSSAIGELEAYGLLEPVTEAGERALFSEDALAVVTIAAAMSEYGIQARHLRMYKQFAEREAVLYGQAILALLRQRNPEARVRARDALVELARLGRSLRTVALRRALERMLAE